MTYTISFLWIPGHVGINGNKYADFLASSIANQTLLGPHLCPYTDLVPIHRKFVHKLWKLDWDNLPESYASGYKTIFKNIPTCPWFYWLDISRAVIIKYTRLRTGHNLLPHHSFKLGLNNSSYCPLPSCGGAHCDIQHLLLNCPALFHSRDQLMTVFSNLDINFSLITALSARNICLNKHIIHYILQSGLKI